MSSTDGLIGLAKHRKQLARITNAGNFGWVITDKAAKSAAKEHT